MLAQVPVEWSFHQSVSAADPRNCGCSIHVAYQGQVFAGDGIVIAVLFPKILNLSTHSMQVPIVNKLL